MATGDLRNNLRKLVFELKQIHYPHCELDLHSVAQGIPKAFLPVLHHVFLDYSISLAQHFASKEYDLYGKTDLRFLETVYKILRDEFGYKPQVTKEQFLAIGFAERKIITVCAILKLLRGKHNDLRPQNSRSEKKRGKLQVICEEDGNKENVKGKSNQCKPYYLPGPLPVGTDMRSFQSNKKAVEAGLGLREPLVTRMVADKDSNFEGNEKLSSETEDPSCGKKDSEQLRPSSHDAKKSTPQNFVANNVEKHFVIKNPVLRNADLRSMLFTRKHSAHVAVMEESNAQGQSHVKSVTWDDEAKYPYDTETEGREEITDRASMSCEPIGPMSISVPASIHSIPDSAPLPSYYPVDMGTKVGMTTIPCPVSMTTAPMPSPELMLTPVVKGSQSETLPLSSCEKESQFQRDTVPTCIPISGLPQTQVVRHLNSIEAQCVAPSNIGVQTKAEVFVLRQQVQELQEKLDSVLLSNNEMSARVVLLESRMKLLEEACQKKCSCDTQSLLLVQRKDKKPRQIDCTVVTGFNACADKDTGTSKSITPVSDGEIRGFNANLKSVSKHNSTKCNRNLFTETGQSTTRGGSEDDEASQNDLTFISEKSDEGSSCSDLGKTQGIEEAKTVSPGDKDDCIVVSPLPSISKLSGVFKDSSSTVLNTVVNVHKRLEETRDLLVKSNRNFAEKFSHHLPE